MLLLFYLLRFIYSSFYIYIYVCKYVQLLLIIKQIIIIKLPNIDFFFAMQ